MKKIIVCIISAMMLILFTACSSGSGGGAYQTVTSDKTGLAMEFPGNWSPGSINPSASIEMYSPLQANGVFVIEETVSDFSDGFSLSDYTSVVLKNYMDGFGVTDSPEVTDMQIGGSTPAKQFVISGEVGNNKFEYIFICAEAGGYFFQFGGVSTPSLFDKARPVFDDIFSRVNFDNVAASGTPSAGSGADSGSASAGAPGASTSYQTVSSSDSSITLEFPSDWSAGNTNSDASIEMLNPTQSNGVTVITEAASDFRSDFNVDDYTSIVLQSNIDSLNSTDTPTVNDVTIGKNIPAKQFEVSGEIENTKLVYLVTCAEANGYFIQISAFSLPSQYESAKPVFKYILVSLRMGS